MTKSIIFCAVFPMFLGASVLSPNLVSELFVYTEHFRIYTELFDRTFFVCRILFEGTVYPFGHFFYGYSFVLSPIQIIECSEERRCFRIGKSRHGFKP